jgi:hypothetical protein
MICISTVSVEGRLRGSLMGDRIRFGIRLALRNMRSGLRGREHECTVDTRNGMCVKRGGFGGTKVKFSSP